MRVLLFQTHCCKKIRKLSACKASSFAVCYSSHRLILYLQNQWTLKTSSDASNSFSAMVSYIDFVRSDYHLSTSLRSTLNMLILYPLVSSNTYLDQIFAFVSFISDLKFTLCLGFLLTMYFSVLWRYNVVYARCIIM